MILSNLKRQILKPFIEDLYREENERFVYDFDYHLYMTKFECILRLDEGDYYRPTREEPITRREALERLVEKILGERSEEKVDQLLLMYESYQGSEWEQSDIENFSELKKF